MTRNLILVLSLVSNLNLFCQGTAGIFDDRKFFFTYMNGSISKQEILPILQFYPSLNYITYIDVNGNFKLVVDHKKYTIFPITPDKLKVTNYLMAYVQGLQLGVFNGKTSKKVETFTKGDFKLGDSVLAYIDNYDRLKVYVYDTIYDLMDFSDTSRFQVSDNIVSFHTRDNKFKVFYHHAIYDLENITPNNYKLGRNIIGYNDNIDNFIVFDRGNKIQLESYHIDRYEVSNDFLTYQNNVDEWSLYHNGKTHTLLSTAPKTRLQKRNMLAYTDNAGNFYLFTNGKAWQLENYTPAKYDLWDDLLVYEDMYRVLWGVYKGVKVQISKGVVQGEWHMQNQCVVYWDLTPNTMTVWNKGNLYQYSEVENRR
ncbi:MAG: hypothetical protein ACK58Q_15305 [Chitinophagales bacterium]